MLHQRMVEQYAPPSVLVSPDNKLVHLSEHAGRYLIHPGGELTSSVFKLLREELRVELRTLLQFAREKNEPRSSSPIPVRFNGHTRPVVMQVRPALEPERQGFALIIFDEREPQEQETPSATEQTLVEFSGQATRIQELEQEVEASRQRLQAIVEEYETSQEEMKASNEELQSANEELRSTMEELETSKEELQSINEELQTVNQENRHRVEELAHLTGDLQNLLSATDIATLFLDRDMRILRFSTKLGELFNVRLTDGGRPISDLTHRLGYGELRSDAEAVLSRLTPIEREIRDEGGRWYLTRVLPYRSTEDRIEGVVITFFDITSRKRTEEALRSSEERLRRIVNVEVVSVLTFDGSGVLIDCNDAFIKMCGYTREEVASRKLSWRSLTPPEYQNVTDKEMQRLAETGHFGPYEKEYIHKDGTRSWMLFVGASLGDGTIVEYCVDIMGRKRAEQEMQESKFYAESIVDAMDEPLLMLTPDLKVRSANPAFYRQFAVRPEQAVGRSIFAMSDGQWDIPALHRLLEEVLPDNPSFNDFELDHKFHSIGRRVWLLNVRRLDNLQLVVLGIRDITEKKQADEARQQSAERYRLLVESATEYAIFMIDLLGNVDTWNIGAERIFGYSEQEIVGHSAEVIFTEEDRACGAFQDEMKTAAETGHSADDRWQQRKDGSRFWASGVMEALLSPDGSVRSYVKVLRDNSERKATEERVHAANQALSRANEDLRQFAFAASHDLREPLRTIGTFSQLLVKAWHTKREDEVERAVQFVVGGVERMDRLLSDLLAYTQLSLHPEDLSDPVDLNQVLEKTLDNLKATIEQTSTQVSHTTLPVVQGRESDFILLFQNLIENAVKYRNERESRVHLASERVGREWRLSVSDNGIGIEPQYYEQIFGIFKRLQNRQIPGTGIGLAICRRVVERLGGRIWVESEVDKGSTFYFTLPANDGQ